MPRKMRLKVNGLLQNTMIIAIFSILIFSSFICIFEGRPSSNIEQDYDVNFFKDNTQDNIMSPQNTRSGDDEYLNLVWEAGHGTEIGRENAIVSADVDNDGIKEVIFGNYEGYIHIIQYSNGEYIDEWKSTDLGSSTQALTAGDVDNDGIIEIIVGTGGGDYYIFGYQPGNGSYMQEWTDYLFAWDVLALATADVDNDGFMEIIAGTSSFAQIPVPNVHVFGYDGSSYELEWVYWAEDSYLNNARTVAVGDVDNDGSIEFVVGISEFKYSTETPRGSFYVFGYNNGIYTLEWKRDDNSIDIVDIDIGDVDSDGLKEIVVGSGSVNIYGYESGLYHIENVIPVTFANVEVGNVNNDDIIEIVVSSGRYLSIWQETTEIWYSDDSISQYINGIEINDTNENLYNEIVLAFGSYFEDSGIMILEFDGSDFKVEWESQYILSVFSICVDDVDNDLENELILGMDYGFIYIFGYENGEYIIEDNIVIPSLDYVENIFSIDFDDDGFSEIAAIIYDEIYFIKNVNGNYEIIDLVELTDGYVYTAETGDVDNDGLTELVVGLSGGFLKVIGFDGFSYTVEWQNQVYTEYVTSLGIGDTNNNGELEIVLGGYDIDVIFTEYKVIILGYDGNNYVQKWLYQTDGRIDAVDVGDSDNDGLNEIAFMNGSFDLYIYGWDGTSYISEWSTPDFTGIYDKCLDISAIEINGENKLIIAEDELYVINYETTYEYQWQTDTINTYIECIFVEDTNNRGSNEIVVSIGAYIFIYGREIRPTANLYTSKENVFVGEEITFDGSNSSGEGTLEYFFDFGDGINSGWITDSMITHSYTSVGIYIASLSIKDEYGIQSMNPTEITIDVIEPNITPTAYIDEISPDSAIEGEPVTFTGHGIDEDGTISSYLWESSLDGYLSSKDTFTRSSLSIGDHVIYFKVMDDSNLWSEFVQKTLEIKAEVQNQVPKAYIDSISLNQGFEGDTISFSGHGTDDDGSIVSYVWESDIDGSLSDQSDFSTAALSLGAHVISFRVQDNNDAWSEAVEEGILIEAIPPNQAPTAEIDSISPNPAIEGETISFSGHGEDEDGSIDTYSWESNIDGFLSSKRSFSTSDISKGEHVITFKVEDDDGKWSETVTMILIIQEKEEESNDLLSPVFIGLVISLIIAIIVTVIVISIKKKSRSNTTKATCPNCGSAYNIILSERPITVQCPICDYTSTIN